MAYKITRFSVIPTEKGIEAPVKEAYKVDDRGDLLPELDLENYKKKADEYEAETKKYKITPIQRVELYHQIKDLGITGHFVSLNNGFRVNKGKINYDIFYDEGKDTYVVYKINNKKFDDFTTKKFDDVYVEDLKQIIK